MQHVPNILSVSRVPFTFFIAYFIQSQYQYRYSISLALIIIASFTDFLDGWAARRFRVVSTFGILFDSLADKILVIGVFAVFLTDNLFPKCFIYGFLTIVSREFAVSGLRIGMASKNIVLAAEKGGKIKCAVQMVSACFTLGALSLSELGVADDICNLVNKMGQAGFVASSLLSVQSGWAYFSKYGSLLIET